MSDEEKILIYERALIMIARQDAPGWSCDAGCNAMAITALDKTGRLDGYRYIKDCPIPDDPSIKPEQ